MFAIQIVNDPLALKLTGRWLDLPETMQPGDLVR